MSREIRPYLALFVVAALVLLFGMIAEEVLEGDTHEIDRRLLLLFRETGDVTNLIGPDWFEEVVRDITALGSYSFIIILLIAATGYLLLVGKRRVALFLLVAEAGGMLLSNLLKTGFDRPRPDLEHGARVFTSSFPSGHATLSAVTFLTLGALLTRTTPDRRVKLYFLTLAAVLTMLVGTSRVYLGVHYPSDVVAGWCIGSAWAALCWAAALWLQRHGDVERADEESIPPS
ncbi:phosphatase PAP2 family protein [Sphingomonas xanthus]|uniref:Phosphatase PAP2 family protein n=2 Tax=Sphingomonas xanthus TaxID=2594473 RepID=A0A516IUD6_9SPHN|nr:phosphatase PAP2 family protein [Sphingomonas xanthus]